MSTALAQVNLDIGQYLEQMPIRAAYLLGYLDEPYAAFCRWHTVSSRDSYDAVALHYTGLSVPAVLTAGDPDPLRDLLRRVRGELPPRFYLQVLEEHEPILEGVVGFEAKPRRTVRMALWQDEFRPAVDAPDVVPLGHADTGDLYALYEFYPDAFFEPYQLEGGYYCGVRRGGKLVAVAGVHAVSERYGIAVVGNVLTHPAHRRQGLSAQCTRYLVERLVERCPLVVLDVEERNSAARAAFRMFGFTERFAFVEGPARVLWG